MLMILLSLFVLSFWLSRIPHYRAGILRDLPVELIPQSLAKVSLIVAARDEAAGISASVRSLLAQDWPDLELIIVDDRSTDGTSAILDELVAEFTALQVIHNDRLPEGWLGKCWALHLGAERASGEWLIFCDGDVVMQSHAVRAAVATCQIEHYDHLCLAPRMISQNYAQDAVVSSLSFLFYLFQNPRSVFDEKRPGSYIGIGAFNMVRRDLYRQIGGHEALRMEIVDDVFLGMLVKRYGGRSAFFLGLHVASIHWYAGLWQYIKGLEKNSFAGLRFSWSLLLLAVIFQSLVFFVPPLALFNTDGIGFVFWLLSTLLAHGLFIRTCQRQGTPWTRGLALYPAIAVQIFTFIRSAWLMSRQQKVIWRGTSYSLTELKAAQKKLRGPFFRPFW